MTKLVLKRTTALVGALIAISAASPVLAQDSGDEEGDSRNRAVNVEPYIEVSQIAIAELSPGDEVVTYTQVAAGIDASVTGRNNGGSVSLRYERNIGYGDDSVDSDTISGVARGYASIVPQVLTVEAGALAAIKHARRPCVTVAVDRMTFNAPVRLGDLVTFEAQVTWPPANVSTSSAWFVTTVRITASAASSSVENTTS